MNHPTELADVVWEMLGESVEDGHSTEVLFQQLEQMQSNLTHAELEHLTNQIERQANNTKNVFA